MSPSTTLVEARLAMSLDCEHRLAHRAAGAIGEARCIQLRLDHRHQGHGDGGLGDAVDDGGHSQPADLAGTLGNLEQSEAFRPVAPIPELL